MSRNKIIALDFAAGVPATELALREGLSLPRIYQVVEKIHRDYRAPKGCSKEELGLIIFRRVAGSRDPDTPEGFYWGYTYE